MRAVLLVLPLLAMTSCATIIEGTSQSVAIVTEPAGANCSVDRAGTHLGQVSPTPGSVHVDKSKNDLSITCTKDGFQTATIAQSPKFQGTTFGNIVAGGLVGVVVDASTGANYAYANDVRLTMAPVPQPATVQTFAPVQPVSTLTGRPGS